jgi:caa(3)-type oxidase subunit IV
MAETTTSPTRFPRLVRRTEAEHAPSQMTYIKVAIFLAIVTLGEVLIYQWNTDLTWLYIAVLVVLAAIKFATVVAFFMHLRFDGPLPRYVFVFGLALAFAALGVAVLSLKAIQG